MILVTGGTGLVGSHLLYQLSLQEDNIVAIYRNVDKITFTKKVFGYYTKQIDTLFDKIKWIEADLTDIPALEIAFKEVNTVYHCAADLSFQDIDYLQSKATNITGTANIVNLCLSNNVTKLCHVSSVATIGENLKGLITENTYWIAENNKNNIYAITKYHAEMEVWRGIQEGLNAVIVNPGVIIGPGFWQSNTGNIFTKVANGFKYYTSGYVGIVDVNDVVKTMIGLIASTIQNERFIIVSENISYQKLIQIVSDIIKPNQQLKPLQKWHLNLYYGFEKIKHLFVKGKPSLSKANIASSFKHLNYDNSKIKEALTLSFIPVEQCLKNTANLYLKDH